jgi:Zn-dependent alcohol dehydrogenase
MEVRAAVAHKPGEPLSIETVRLDGPKAGEVMVGISGGQRLDRRDAIRGQAGRARRQPRAHLRAPSMVIC